jgi:glycosyltransferase involved in cell wall biosynthesis
VRQFYDLWGSEYSGLHANLGNLHIKDELLRLDNAAFAESKKIFTNSQVVTDRLLAFNKVSSEVLYPPIWKPERFSCKGFNDEVVYLSRIEAHKRQHLLIEALQHTKTPVRIRFMGRSDTPYVESLSQLCESLKVSDRVSLDNRWVTEEEKEQVLSECLAVAYLPYDEDSYGYPSLEASHSRKPILTTTDSGGVLELVENRSNGLVSQPTPQALAECLDAFYTDREQTKRMGINAHERLSDLHISWPHVCSRLLS